VEALGVGHAVAFLLLGGGLGRTTAKTKGRILRHSSLP
jgi:hypothetical protein